MGRINFASLSPLELQTFMDAGTAGAAEYAATIIGDLADQDHFDEIPEAIADA